MTRYELSTKTLPFTTITFDAMCKESYKNIMVVIILFATLHVWYLMWCQRIKTYKLAGISYLFLREKCILHHNLEPKTIKI